MHLKSVFYSILLFCSESVRLVLVSLCFMHSVVFHVVQLCFQLESLLR